MEQEAEEETAEAAEVEAVELDTARFTALTGIQKHGRKASKADTVDTGAKVQGAEMVPLVVLSCITALQRKSPQASS